ncbi:hypothetical protein [Sinosporangium siamense]|uniref:Secreted protein n=1 Tax=Sinosporangium siamense TaxID=1367973 RepID=A0A919RQI5_9ACTN|nr:hypothetical protein [Sinosporangium siamense]GII97422.1 hypothetical protein Ssi02_76530 [Sinosporangium siamense]
MNRTRKMWISAAVVGAVLVGGISVSTAAAAGLPGGKSDGRPAGGETAPHGTPAEGGTPAGESSKPDDYVVSHDLQEDPEDTADYWTEERMSGVEPMPMPVAPDVSEEAGQPQESPEEETGEPSNSIPGEAEDLKTD